jgi:hypothetical protein
MSSVKRRKIGGDAPSVPKSKQTETSKEASSSPEPEPEPAIETREADAETEVTKSFKDLVCLLSMYLMVYIADSGRVSLTRYAKHANLLAIKLQLPSRQNRYHWHFKEEI